MRLLVDAQLPPALAHWLGEHGLSATAARDLELRHRRQLDSVTKDEDFVSRSIADPAGPRIVWLRIGNSTNRMLFRWLEPQLSGIMRRLEEGDKLIELR